MLLISHLIQIRTTINAMLCCLQQAVPDSWNTGDADHADAPATTDQIYNLLSDMGAVQELVPKLTAQLKRSLEVITGSEDYYSLY